MDGYGQNRRAGECFYGRVQSWRTLRIGMVELQEQTRRGPVFGRVASIDGGSQRDHEGLSSTKDTRCRILGRNIA